jgi:hypothetical protein
MFERGDRLLTQPRRGGLERRAGLWIKEASDAWRHPTTRQSRSSRTCISEQQALEMERTGTTWRAQGFDLEEIAEIEGAAKFRRLRG